MNEQIQQEILKYLQAFSAGIEKAGAFTAEQAPLVVQEFLSWQVWGNLIFISLVNVIFSFYCYLVSKVFTSENFNCEHDKHCAKIVLFFVSISFYTLATLDAYKDAGKALIAPRVVVIEKISELTGVRK